MISLCLQTSAACPPGVPCQRKRSPEGDMQDLPPAKTPPVVSGGAVAVERSPPVCEGELFGVSSPSVRLRWNGYAF